MIATMGLIGLIASILLVVTYFTTKPYIDANLAAYLESAIGEVLPGISSRRTFRIADGKVTPDDEGLAPPGSRVFAGFDSLGTLQGLAIEAQGQGYADVILVLYGYDPGCRCIIGFKVLDSRETPGLGDRIQRDQDFLANFDSLDVRWIPDSMSVEGPIELAKHGTKTAAYQIDAISGATISSRAVTSILNAGNKVVLRAIHENLDQFTPNKDVH